MSTQTTMGTGNGSIESVYPIIRNKIVTANLAAKAVTREKLAVSAPVFLIAATVTITAVTHANLPLVLTRAAGVVATLPKASGSGNSYIFYVDTSVTTNSYKIQVANATDVINGLAFGLDGDGVPANAWSSGTTGDTVTMDGSTQGGIRGDSVEILDVAAGLFVVKAYLTQSGTEATPFSAAVA